MVTLDSLKHSAVFLLVLPAYLWLGVCLCFLNTVGLLLWMAGRRQACMRMAEFTFAAVHRPFLLLLPWSNSRVLIYGDNAEELVKEFGCGQSMIIMNHRGNLDWMIGLYLNDCGGGIGAAKAIVKRSLLYLPILGFVWWCSDFLCITRDWKHASQTLLEGYRRQLLYKELGVPYSLALFPEGTRITEKKLLESQDFAKQHGMPVFKHLLIPRQKGFWSSLQTLQLDAIYDITMAEKGGPKSNFMTLASGHPAEFHVHVERFNQKDIPHDQEECKKWLLERWIRKEKLLQRLEDKGNFGTPSVKDVPVRQAAYRTLQGAVAFYLASSSLFVYLCIRLDNIKLLMRVVQGSTGFILLIFLMVALVHLKPSSHK